MAYSVTIDNNNFQVSLARTGGQGSKGNSVTNVYVNVNNNLLVDISDSTGAVIETLNVGNLTSLTNAAVAENLTNAFSSPDNTFITITEQLNGVFDFVVETDKAATPDTIVERTATGGVASSSLDLDTGNPQTPNVGQITWNDTDGTASLGLEGGNVKVQLGQEEVIKCRNVSGVNYTNGTVVLIDGAQQGFPTVDVADYSSAGTADKTIGVTTEAITKNTTGYVTITGFVRNLDTSSFAEGAVLWLGPNGTMTTTKPTTPNHSVMIGWCVTSHPSTGSIFVKIEHGHVMGDVNDVLLTSLADGDAIVYDMANQYWKNVNLNDLYATDSELTAVNNNLQTQINGKASTDHTHTLNQLTDVDIGAVTDNWLLTYNSNTNLWGAAPASVTPSSTTSFTNKSIDLGSNTISGTALELNTAVSDANIAISFATRADFVTWAASNTPVNGALYQAGGISLPWRDWRNGHCRPCGGGAFW